MCALCGIMSVPPHWSSAAPVVQRPAVSHDRIVVSANRMLANDHVKISLFGGRMQVAGPTGRTEIVEHLGALWHALDKMNVRIDALDPRLVARMEKDR